MDSCKEQQSEIAQFCRSMAGTLLVFVSVAAIVGCGQDRLAPADGGNGLLVEETCEGSSCDGAQAADPCEGILCHEPPPPYCVDANTTRVSAWEGECVDGLCEYEYLDTPCEYGCENGACTFPNSRTVDCTPPPVGAESNTATAITQSWNGSGWVPSNVSLYDESPSDVMCRFRCQEDLEWNGESCVDPYVMYDYIDCVHTPGSVGEDLYWIDIDGVAIELVEDCAVYGSPLNCAGISMTVGGEASAASWGLNSEAFLGCCGPNASTIDRYGCLPYMDLGEPCFGDIRYFNDCIDGLDCRVAVGGESPETCQY